MQSLAPGVHVDRYRIGRTIGRGGMGEVFEATHALLKTRVAIKVLAPHLAQDAEIARRFLREGRNASRVQHPNVVRVLDGGIVDGRPFLAFEYLDGTPLSALTRLGPMSPLQALAVIVPIGHALWWGHELGVIHRDVKPANIMLTADPWRQQNPVLLDWVECYECSTWYPDLDDLTLTESSYLSSTDERLACLRCGERFQDFHYFVDAYFPTAAQVIAAGYGRYLARELRERFGIDG